MATLLFFGRLSDIAPNGNVSLPSKVSDTDALTAWLSEQHDGFSEQIKKQGTRIAVNKSIINDNTPISDSDEIAFMSALSGG